MGGPLGSGPRANPGAGVRLPGTGARGCERSCPWPHPGAARRRPLGRSGASPKRRRERGEVRAGAAKGAGGAHEKGRERKVSVAAGEVAEATA